MRTLLSTLVAAALLGHAFADANRHQTHQCAEQALAAGATISTPCCEHDGKDDEHGPAPARPCDCHLDCIGGCNYLPSQKVLLDMSQMQAPLEALAAAIRPIDTSLMLIRNHHATKWWEFESPPVRLHLFNQILLV